MVLGIHKSKFNMRDPVWYMSWDGRTGIPL